MSVNSKMAAIADAIRAKTGGTDALTLDGMAQAVAGIQAGGVDTLEAKLTNTLTEYSSDAVTTIPNETFSGATALKTVSFPNATKLGDSVFTSSGLVSVNLPSVKSVGFSAFSACTSLEAIELPELTTMESYSAFAGCSKLKTVKLQKLKSIPLAYNSSYGVFSNCTNLETVDLPACTTVGNYAFYFCTKLTSVNIPSCTSIGTDVFTYCYSITSIVLRAETLCKLSNANTFSNCTHIKGTVNATYNPEGLKDGYIYVPDALVEDYKAATNWSTYASQIKPLSEYVEVTA